jgi:phospholipid/cholesterol/gamma-HCH transport system substrate-binding protein
LRRLVRNAGITNEALNERRDQLRQLIINANRFFGATASRDDALAETVFIMPTFLEESRQTNARLREFAVDTEPLIRNLTPVTRMLRPTVRDLGALAPELKSFFRKTDPLIRESDRTLSDGARFVRGSSPLFSALHVYLPEFNPFISFLNWEQEQVADFLVGGSGSLNGFLPGLPGEGPRHYLRQFSITNTRSLAIQTSRQAWDRGLAYPAPNYMKRGRVLGVTESWDCKPLGEQNMPSHELPPCYIQPPSLFDGNHFPRLRRGHAPNRVKPQGNEGRRPAAP